MLLHVLGYQMVIIFFMVSEFNILLLFQYSHPYPTKKRDHEVFYLFGSLCLFTTKPALSNIHFVSR